MTVHRILAAMIAASLSTAVEAKTLKVGDKAPPLSISKWVKGGPVDISKDKDTVYIVEFWATWCAPCRVTIPHLSELQDHFKGKKLVVVGISDEEEDTVKDFLKSWDSKMRYVVALDDGDTNEAYMQAVGAQGIPHAFVVHQGKLAWHGHPMEMDEHVVKLTGDKDWAARVEKQRAEQKKREEAMTRVREAADEEDWDAAIKATDDLIKLAPDQPQIQMQKYFILATKKKDAKAAAEVGRAMVKSIDDANLLNQVAWTMLTDEQFEEVRDIPLATSAAEKAVELTEGKEPAILDTLARARFDGGKLDEALELQEKAVKLCKDERMKPQLEKALKKYRKAKESKETKD